MPPSRLAGAARRRFSRDQRDRRVLRDHEARAHTAVRREKRGQVAHQRIHQPIDAALGHGGEFGDRDAERIGAEADGRTDGVRLGERARRLLRAEQRPDCRSPRPVRRPPPRSHARTGRAPRRAPAGSRASSRDPAYAGRRWPPEWRCPAGAARNRSPTRQSAGEARRLKRFGLERRQSGRADSRRSSRRSDPPSRAAARCAATRARSGPSRTGCR